MIRKVISLIQVVPYTEKDALRWDKLVVHSPMATFLHTRRFLCYHGTRFRDCSLLILDTNGRLIGLFPAAVDQIDGKKVVSHPGITFGGVLHAGKLYGESMMEALSAIIVYFSDLGFERLRYKAVPYIYHHGPGGDDLYALFRFSAVRDRCDLSTAIDLSKPVVSSQRRRRGLATALRDGIVVREGIEFIRDFWGILEENLAQKYQTNPTHSLDEMSNLFSLFPDNIRVVVGLFRSKVVAGTILFMTPLVAHAQYIASNETGLDACALDAVFDHCIAQAASEGKRYFDFGISTEKEGEHLNVGLYDFKRQFGGGGVVHEFYSISLARTF